MIAFAVRRFIQAIVVLLAVSLIAFVMFKYVGDPISQMVGPETPIDQREALREQLGLNDPVPLQFMHYLGDVVQGNFGRSFRTGLAVDRVLLERIPATLELAIVAVLYAVVAGIPMGVYSGLYPDRWLSKFFQTVSLIGISLPTFFVGVILIYIFGPTLNLLPTFGRGEVVHIGFWSTGLLTVSGLKSIILPAFTLGMFQLTLIMRLVRSEMLEVLRTDYIKFARARGLSNRAVNFGHALKNTLVPVITVIGLQLGQVIAFAIITEAVFQWPGMGLLFLQAIQFADVPVMSTYLLVVAVFFVAINLVVDLLYYVIDPRLRLDRAVAQGG